MKTATSINRVEKIRPVDLVDQAHLDLGFVRGFIDMLYNIAGDGHVDSLNDASISAMCHESLVKIENIKKFIDGKPMELRDVKAT